MKHLFFISLLGYLLILPGMLFGQASKSTVRLLIPISEQSKADQFENSASAKTEDPSTSGFSLMYKHPNNFGIGYSALTTTFKSANTASEIDYKLQSSYYDIFYVFGDELNLTLGVGIKSNANATINLKGYGTLDGEYQSNKESATAYFVHLGYGIGNLEILFGYRVNNLKYDEFKRNDGATLTGSVSGSTAQVNAGIGYKY